MYVTNFKRGHKMEENKENFYCKIERTVNFFRKIWGSLVMWMIGFSIIALFTSSLIFKENIELQTINNWIGIILGLVATLMSIISLFLSFYNLEKEHEESRANNELLNEMKIILRDIEKNQNELDNSLKEQREDTREIRRCVTKNENKPEIVNQKNDKKMDNTWQAKVMENLNNVIADKK